MPTHSVAVNISDSRTLHVRVIKAQTQWINWLAAPLMLLSSMVSHAEELKLATAYPAENFHTVNIQTFVDGISKASSGKVAFKLYPKATLYKGPEIFEAVRSGKIEAGELIMSSLTKESPLLELDSLPFVVTGYEDAQKLWRLQRPAVEKVLTERGVKLLYAVPWPPQNLYSTTAINRAKDMKGLRLRTYNAITNKIAELTESKPVSLQVAELANAIANDQLDMMITSSWTGNETKAWTKMKFFYTINAWIPKNIVFMNKKFFDGLDRSTQDKITALAQEAEKRGWEQSKNEAKTFDEILARNKIKIAHPEAFLRTDFQTIGDKISREWIKKAGFEGLDILLKYETERFEAKSK